MKKSIILTTLVAALSLTAWAADTVKLEGEAQCGKCALKESKTCVNTITVTKDGQKEVYWAEPNDVAKAFHSQICQGSKQVVAEGAVCEKEGKKMITLTKIEEKK